MFTYFVYVELEHLSYVSSKKMSWYINNYSITDLCGYRRAWPNKCYRSVCWLKITRCMDQLNVSNLCHPNPSIQRYGIDQNRSLDTMHFWKITWRMTDDNSCNDSVHLFHSLYTHACEPSGESTITWEGNHTYFGWYVQLFYLVWYKFFDKWRRLTNKLKTNRLHPAPGC